MKRVLVLDGGGVKGVIQSKVISEIERKTGKPCTEIFDMIVGTSIGSILGSALALGTRSAEDLHNDMLQNLPLIFRRRLLPGPRYSKKHFDRYFDEKFGIKTAMSCCQTKFMTTSVNITDGKTHYFKSWEEKDGALSLHDAVSRSFAAPLYFGAIADPVNRDVWIDGGTGDANTPLITSSVELFRQNWLPSTPVHLLSIGAGYHDYSVPYSRAARYRNLRQVLFFMSPKDGGLARKQLISTNVTHLKAMSQKMQNFSFQRLDKLISPKMDIMDGIKFIPSYESIGEYMSSKIQWEYLLD